MEPEYKPGKQTRESDLTHSILLAQKIVSTLPFLFHEGVCSVTRRAWVMSNESWALVQHQIDSENIQRKGLGSMS